jgi:hypothetical protein
MTTTQALLDEACPIIGKLGAAFYFTPETLARGKELGLGGFRFYFLGRGGVLGDVEAPVIASAFGYFEPGLVAHLWSSSKAVLAPRAAGRAYFECAYELARSALAGVEELDGFCHAAEQVVAAADPAGLALYAGMLGEPLPDDASARAMHLLVQLRELRGSAHLLAVRASGLEPKVAHYLRRPGDFVQFGWKEEDTPSVTDDDRRRLADADELTDRLVGPAFGVLDDPDRTALLDGLRAMGAVLGDAA